WRKVPTQIFALNGTNFVHVNRTRWSSRLKLTSVLKKTISRTRQSKMVAQSCAFIIASKQPAPWQSRDDPLDKIVEPARQIRKHHGKAVGAFRFQPLLHFVGNGFRRADHRQSGITAKPLRELADGQVLAPAERDGALAPALGGIAFGNVVRQWPIGIEFRSRHGRAQSIARRLRWRSRPGCQAWHVLLALVRWCR